MHTVKMFELLSTTYLWWFRGRSGGWYWAYWWDAFGWFWTLCTPHRSATRATPDPTSSNMFTICIFPSFSLSSHSSWWFVLVWLRRSPNLSRWNNTHYTKTCMRFTFIGVLWLYGDMCCIKISGFCYFVDQSIDMVHTFWSSEDDRRGCHYRSLLNRERHTVHKRDGNRCPQNKRRYVLTISPLQK